MQAEESHFSSQLGLIVSVCAALKIVQRRRKEEDCHPVSPPESGADSVRWIVYKTIVTIHKCNRD